MINHPKLQRQFEKIQSLKGYGHALEKREDGRYVHRDTHLMWIGFLDAHYHSKLERSKNETER